MPLGTSHKFNLGPKIGEIHWVEAGAGPAIILLHGLSDTHRTWRQVAPALVEQGYRVLIPDLLGHGISGRPDGSYSVDWHAKALSAWIAHVKLRRFDLIGHSFGGGIALQLLINHSHQIRHLALIASGGFGAEVSASVKLLALPGADKFLQAGLSVGTRVGLRFAAGGGVDDKDRIWHAWANGAPGTGRALSRTVANSVGIYGQRESFYDNIDRIKKLPPITLFWGDRDPIIPYSQALRAAKEVPNLRLIRFRGCGHFPHLERHEDLNPALSAFLGPPRKSFWRRKKAKKRITEQQSADKPRRLATADI